MRTGVLNINRSPEMLNYEKFQVIDFIEDEQFRLWIKNPEDNPDLNNFWKQWLDSYPQKKDLIDEARNILLNINLSNEACNVDKQHELWQKIKESIDDKRLRYIL